MAEITIFNQPFDGAFSTRLVSLIDECDYSRLTIISAFAKVSGVERLLDPIREFRRRHGKVSVFVGVDLDGTSYEALDSLNQVCDELYVIHSSKGNQTFHPKAYNLVNESKAVLAVGSNNLTDGGLRSNAETTLIAALDLCGADDRKIQDDFDGYIEMLRRSDGLCLKIESHNDIDSLRESGLLPLEKETRKPRKVASASKPAIATSNLPFSGHFSTLKTNMTAPVFKDTGFFSKSVDSLWVETNACTGGSRNQIDLSMSGILEYSSPTIEFDGAKSIAPGAVEYFGIDPKADNETVPVNIEFEGKRYSGPYLKNLNNKNQPKQNGKGTLVNPNGSWRIYLTATNQDGEKLSSQLKKGAGKNVSRIQFKIVVFTRTADAIKMEIFNKSLLPEFEEKSLMVARTHGQNPRRYGFIATSDLPHAHAR